MFRHRLFGSSRLHEDCMSIGKPPKLKGNAPLRVNGPRMKKLSLLFFFLVVTLVISLRLLSAHAEPAAQWQVDPVHSSISFAVDHMGVSEVRGEFTKFAVNGYYDGKSLKSASVSAEIDAASIDTRNAKRDGDLRSDTFLDVARYPTIVFKSKRFRSMSRGRFQLVGELAIHGVTRTVVLDGRGPSLVIKDYLGNQHVGASATTEINRKDYGLKFNKLLEGGGLLVGEMVRITLSVDFVKPR